MEIRYGALQEPKPGSNAGQCEDAFAYSDTSALVAVCDGAGTAFESRLWARLLARGFVEHSPLGGTDDDLLDWADFIAAQWSQSIPWQALNLFQEQKARSGSAATLVGLQLTLPPQEAASGMWHCLALGDSCLFHVSHGRLVEALPLDNSADFKSHSPLLSTERRINLRSIAQAVTVSGTWQEGDSFFLLTDAIAQWFLRENELGTAPWGVLTSLDESRFPAFVQDTQAQRLMRKDDATAFMIGLGVPLSTRGTPAPVPIASPWLPDLVPAGPVGTLREPFPRPPKQLPEKSRRSPQPGPPSRTAPPDRTELPDPAGVPGWSVRSRRRRAPLIGGGVAILCAGIAIALASAGGGSPPAHKAAQPVPQVQPAARDFAGLLTTYPGRAGTSYQAYETKLDNDVVGGNAAQVTQLLGLSSEPTKSFSSQGQATSTAVVQSGKSQAELYILVSQTITAPYNKVEHYQCKTRQKPVEHSCVTTQPSSQTTSRVLLIDLTMTRPGQKWLVSSATVRLVSPPFSPPSGALVPAGSTR